MSTFRKFQVRDLSGFEEYQGEYDIVYHDDKAGVVRYSDETYDSHKEAQDVAERYEAQGYEPTDWDVCKA